MTYHLNLHATDRYGNSYEEDTFWPTAEDAREYMMNHEDRLRLFSLTEMETETETGCGPLGCPGPSCCWSWD